MIFDFFITNLLNQYVLFEGALGFVRIIGNVIIALIFMKSSVFEKIVVCTLSDITLLIISFLSLNILSGIFGFTVPELIEMNGLIRIINLFVTKFVFFMFTRIIIAIKKKEAYITSVPNLTFVTVSEWLSGVVRSSVVGSVPVQVISNGVDCTRFYPHTDIQAIKQKYGCGNRFMIVGVSSHWSASKGLYDYYKLRELLPADQFVVVLVGITSEQENNIPDGIIGVERTENLDELALIYSAADVVTSLSYQETFGLTIVEGFACGTPAVVYDNTALPELVDSDTGLVVETGNMERLVEAIRQVCKTGKSFYSQACREVAQTRYDKFCQYEKYVELYEQALISKKV